MPEKRVAVYPGTFDPITLGHVDIIERACRLMDHLIIAVAANAGKQPMFSLDERMAVVREEVAALQREGPCRMEVKPFDTLLVRFAAEVGARMVVRGLRAVSDFEYEFQMAGMNARLNPEIETVFLMASERQQFVSSRFVKEIARLGGDVASFVSPNVVRRLGAAVARERAGGEAAE
ncbi:MAG: pantetheine-phosphate adenylyltransferase [Alphaproteobacteria bacterium]